MHMGNNRSRFQPLRNCVQDALKSLADNVPPGRNPQKSIFALFHPNKMNEQILRQKSIVSDASGWHFSRTKTKSSPRWVKFMYWSIWHDQPKCFVQLNLLFTSITHQGGKTLYKNLGKIVGPSFDRILYSSSLTYNPWGSSIEMFFYILYPRVHPLFSKKKRIINLADLQMP